MKRGEIWWVDFDPARGSEIRKTRPAIIVSNDLSNTHTTRVQVIPLTSHTEKLYPPECFINAKGKKAKAMADQIMTVSKERLKEQIGKITNNEQREVDRVLLLQLSLTTKDKRKSS